MVASASEVIMERFRARLAMAFLATRPNQGNLPRMLALTQMSWDQYREWIETEALPAAEQGLIAADELVELRAVTQSEFESEIAQGESRILSMMRIKPH